MGCLFAIVATGEKRYLDEAVASIRWHHQREPSARFILFVDDASKKISVPAEIRVVEPIVTSLPPMVVGWYRKTQVLKQLLDTTDEPVCLLDTYARILRFDLFRSGLELAEKFHLCLSHDPRRTLERELALGRGIGPEIKADLASAPRFFPLWNTGVILANSHPASRCLVSSWEEWSRRYLDRGLLFREQLTLIQAVADTKIFPFTLPDSFNVRRPWVDPAIVLHTRRFAHAYGVPEVDRPEQSFERIRHQIKLALGRTLGLDRWFNP
jgi:hypothetical protein